MLKPKCVNKYAETITDVEDNPNVHWHVKVYQPSENGERLLILTFSQNVKNRGCSWNNSRPQSFLLAASKKQSDYAMYSPDGKRVSGTFREVLRRCGTDIYSMYPVISDEDERKLCKWLNVTADGLNHGLITLVERLDDLRRENKRLAAMRRGDIEEDAYTSCPDKLPKGLTKWIRESVLTEDNVLLYKRGGMRGTCFRCGHKVRNFPGAKHFRQHGKAHCPHCGREVYCVLEGGASWDSDYVANIAAMQKGSDGTLWIRQWHIRRDNEAQFEDIPSWLKEFGRYAIRDNKVARWLSEGKESYFCGGGLYARPTWEKVDGVQVFDRSYSMFPDNIIEATRDTRLQYADIIGYMQSLQGNNPIRFICDFARYPILEFLQKKGYERLIREWIYGVSTKKRSCLNRQAKSIKQAFPFPARWLSALPTEEWTWDMLQAVKKAYATDTSAEKFTLADVRDIAESALLNDRLNDIVKSVGIRKVVKYLKSQPKVSGALDDITYADYLQECKELNLDITAKEILFPKNLRAAHQRTMAQVEYKKNRKCAEKFAAETEKFEKYAWEKGALLIRPARDPAELTIEGKSLHHCVGGYVDRVANGETMIFFIRRANEPDIPYYTVELKDKRVTQCYTAYDKTCEAVGEPFIREFLNAWLERIVKRGGVRRKKQKTA